MDTPVVDFVEKYSSKQLVRLHMPGHKGSENPFDITEIKGADVLYNEDGILGRSQYNASVIYGTAKTVYSVEGSSLGIRGILSLIKMFSEKTGRRPVIAAGRNAHKVFMTCSAILNIEIRWIYPDVNEGLVSAVITPEKLRCFLEECEELPVAVYITSPDYTGNVADIKGLSEVCREFGVLLAVDNAHGAYLRFLPEDMHPITLGADMCCDSAHKTLPVLTGGAYLHISHEAPPYIAANAEKAMALFASTSPSYVVLASLDRVNRALVEGYADKIKTTADRISALKERLQEKGYTLSGNEPLKITLNTKEYGYEGTEFSEILRENKLECEFADPDFAVMMITPENGEEELLQLEKVLLSIPAKEKIVGEMPEISPCEQVIGVSEALFKASEKVSVNEACGRILASPSVSCPPAIPIAICGEKLNENAVNLFRYYGISEIDVITE